MASSVPGSRTELTLHSLRKEKCLHKGFWLGMFVLFILWFSNALNAWQTRNSTLLVECCLSVFCETELLKCVALFNDGFQPREDNRCSNCCKSLLRTLYLSCLCFYENCLTSLELSVIITNRFIFPDFYPIPSSGPWVRCSCCGCRRSRPAGCLWFVRSWV